MTDQPIRTLSELDRVRDDCKAMVTKRSLVSAGTAVVPIPGIDLIADVGLLTKMLPDISERFGLSHEQVAKMDAGMGEQVLVVATSLGNTVIGRAITRRIVTAIIRRVGLRVAGASVAKFVPFLGQAAAASLSFGAMKLAGNRHVDDCYETVKRTLLANRAALDRGAITTA
ncbi:MAG TPA: hypothetical protein VFQ57_01800 [Sphingomonas sp.]|jgi:uncharacterized protein (DUF697 family)|nr:hypothetical protein [Sphingomonas sp.]